VIEQKVTERQRFLIYYLNTTAGFERWRLWWKLHIQIGTVREVEARRGAFHLTARQRVADAGAMTLGASNAISSTALPPGTWNGDGAYVSRFLKLFIERGMYPALL
jgi:hypothetical protein